MDVQIEAWIDGTQTSNRPPIAFFPQAWNVCPVPVWTSLNARGRSIKSTQSDNRLPSLEHDHGSKTIGDSFCGTCGNRRHIPGGDHFEEAAMAVGALRAVLWLDLNLYLCPLMVVEEAWRAKGKDVTFFARGTSTATIILYRSRFSATGTTNGVQSGAICKSESFVKSLLSEPTQLTRAPKESNACQLLASELEGNSIALRSGTGIFS
ncbi:membrane protein [Anopheles sinensis]|uniref:Membrane protein n=1 Tax=Anopheles sinensis TaxID=74873 RepID=A0A084VFA3_ANOSI|nr:membrane protein [Anopheles sinensis]